MRPRRDSSGGEHGYGLMPLPREIVEQMGEQRLAAQLQAARDRRRLWLRTAILCVFWLLLGLSLLAWSMHTTAPFYGRLAFWAGLGIGDGAPLLTVVRAWRVAERRGWI